MGQKQTREPEATHEETEPEDDISDAFFPLFTPDEMRRYTVDFAESLQSTEHGDAKQSGGASKVRQVLDAHGFCVVTNVLSIDTCDKAELCFGQDLRTIVEPSLCTRPNLEEILADPVHNWPLRECQLGYKFVNDYGLAVGKCAFAVRGHPNVHSVFASVHGTNDICSALDSIFFQNSDAAVKECPPEEHEERLWPHTDFNRNEKPSGTWDCYQGILYLWEASEETSATVIWPDSHKEPCQRMFSDPKFKRMVSSGSNPEQRPNHFCPLPNRMLREFVANARRVPVPRGGLLLFDVKTIHQGWSHGKRLAVPVCFEPAKRRTLAALDRKRLAVLEGQPTTHWASLGLVHGSGESDKQRYYKDTNGVNVVEFAGLALQHTAHHHALVVGVPPKIRPEIEKLL